MIESISINTQNKPLIPQTIQKSGTGKTLSYRPHGRMAGSIAVWTPQKPVPSKPEQAFEQALTGHNSGNGIVPEKVLSYVTTQKETKETETPEEFGFGDILDMVNPLQHIPLVSSVYREVTGDEIKPVSRIIGGAVYGGAAGAGTALVNAVIEYDTGTDIAGNVMKLASGKPVSHLKHTENLPESLLQFTDQSAKASKPASKWTSFALNG